MNLIVGVKNHAAAHDRETRKLKLVCIFLVIISSNEIQNLNSEWNLVILWYVLHNSLKNSITVYFFYLTGQFKSGMYFTIH